MEQKNLMAIIAVIAVVEVILACCIIYVMIDDKSSGEDSYTLYIGLNDSKTHEDYDPDVAAGWVDEIVLKYSSGLTRYQADGAYTYDDGTIAHEDSLVYTLVGVTLDDVHKICDEVKDKLNQSSVLITVNKQTSEFY